MCGIVGFTGHVIDERDLRRSVASLRHRGPDGSGVFLAADARVGLGHARLAIVDLTTGAQPLYSEERDLVLVCNGEIYDYDRIRGVLEARGHVFATRTDSELIIHLYQEYGLDFVDQLRGEFAFLLYDSNRRELLAVRDRFGIKPLFYNEQAGTFLFASEAKAIFATGRLAPRLSIPALRDYLSGVLPDAIFDGIDVVPPGCILRVAVDSGAKELRQYWDLNLSAGDAADRHTTEGAIQCVREGVEEAVRLRLRADVPVGVYLSGGIDSAIVAATAAQYHTGTIKAFTISFPDDDAFDEHRLAQDMARHIGAELHSVACDMDTLLANVEDFLWVAELPFLNLHGVGKFMLSRLAHQHVKVVLTGEGSDEVFLGYVYFQPGKGLMSDQMSNRLKAKRSPRGRHAGAVIKELGFLPLHEHAIALARGTQRIVAWFFHRTRRKEALSTEPIDRLKTRLDRRQTDHLPPVRQIQYFSFKSILAPYLLAALGDRPELAHGVEGRPPFLDHHLFAKARNIPDDMKIRDGVEKFVLREAFKDRVTDDIYSRKKWPYFAPPLRIKKGRSVHLDALLDRHLSAAALDRSGIFNRVLVRAMRLLSAAIPFDIRLRRALDVILMFTLSVQILDDRYVQRFKERQADLERDVP